jgi:hypothetical protein
MATASGSKLWRGKKIQMIDIRKAIVATLFCGLIGHLSAADKIKIDVRQSKAAIRQQLLRLTPPGTSAKQVFQFLQSRLQRERGSLPGAPGQPYRSTTSVALGHYYDPRTISEVLLPFPTVVQATWKFDERDKLRDVQVRRGIDAL